LARQYKFDKYHSNEDYDIDQDGPSRQSDTSMQIMSKIGTINVNIENINIVDVINLTCFLEYTYDINEILNVYKNGVAIDDYTFDNYTRIITIPLTFDSSTNAVIETETLENIVIYIQTNEGKINIIYSYN
jgi:hypothetical protein